MKTKSIHTPNWFTHKKPSLTLQIIDIRFRFMELYYLQKRETKAISQILFYDINSVMEDYVISSTEIIYKFDILKTVGLLLLCV